MDVGVASKFDGCDVHIAAYNQDPYHRALVSKRSSNLEVL